VTVAGVGHRGFFASSSCEKATRQARIAAEQSATAPACFYVASSEYLTLTASGAARGDASLSDTVQAQASVPPNRVPTARSGIWHPPLVTEWQWQLSSSPTPIINVRMYDIDLFDNDASTVAALHDHGIRAVCYIDMGTWEKWRPDAGQFPGSVLGSSNGWPGEKWLDIRQISVLAPVMEARLDLCKSLGYDGVEPDNIDGYKNSTGFPLAAQDQINYNTWIANQAHIRGLAVALKNDTDQIRQLEPYFDFMLDEQCFEYHECNTLLPFIQAGKAVFEVEYNLSASQFCPQANAMNFNSIKKDLTLGATRTPCR
jgi:hypothetical protein